MTAWLAGRFAFLRASPFGRLVEHFFLGLFRSAHDSGPAEYELSPTGILALLAIPGASAYFLGGAVVYSRRAGRGLLGLTADDMVGLRGETEPYAQLVAGKARDIHRASWGIAESGAAGPVGSPYGDPAGRVCLAVVGASVALETVMTGETDRAMNMDLFARHLLALFERTLSASTT